MGLLDLDLVVGKNVTAWIVPSVAPTFGYTAGVPALTIASSGTAVPISTLGKIKYDNRAEHKIQQASNLGGGVARPKGIRMLNGYFYAWGDTPPCFPNDLIGVNFTLDGVHCATNPCLRCTAIEIMVEPYSEDKKNKVYYVVYFTGAGFDFAEFTAVGNDPILDTTQPIELSTKSLGLGIGGVGSFTAGTGGGIGGAWAGTVVPYVESMKLRVEALATPDWNSSLNGIAFTPRGDIDWHLKLVQRVNRWSTPADTLIGDLDGVQALLMATRLNANLSFNTGWALEWGDLTSKAGDFDHASTKILTAEYEFEKNIYQSGGATKLGSITDPAGVTRWGTINA